MSLILGYPIQSLTQFHASIGNTLRIHILLELIYVLWHFNEFAFGSSNTNLNSLVSIYYGKAYSFTELGYYENALESLKQINQLKVLEKTWAIYPKLLKLTEMLQNRVIKKDQDEHKETQKGLMSVISGIFGFRSESSAETESHKDDTNILQSHA